MIRNVLKSIWIASTLFFAACSSTQHVPTSQLIIPPALKDSVDHQFKITVQNSVPSLAHNEARMAMLTDVFSSTANGLGSEWKLAKTTVWAVNNSTGNIPVPNMLWTATKDGNQVACMHFVYGNEIYTVLVEDKGLQAVAKLDNILSQVTIK